MRVSKTWWTAGLTAGLLIAGPARAAVVAEQAQQGAGEGAVTPCAAVEGETASLGRPAEDARVRARTPAKRRAEAPGVTSAMPGPDAEGAVLYDDALELERGNTGGRG